MNIQIERAMQMTELDRGICMKQVPRVVNALAPFTLCKDVKEDDF